MENVLPALTVCWPARMGRSRSDEKFVAKHGNSELAAGSGPLSGRA